MYNIIYLAGNMTPEPDYYNDWTKKFKERLEEKSFESKNCYKCTTAQYKDTPQMIVQHDLARLKKSDILVANVGLTDRNYHLTGMICEVYEAYKQNKPVYTFVDEGLYESIQSFSPWFDQFVTKKFISMNEIIEYLKHDENLPF